MIGLFIKNDYIPIRANRARHANYEVPKKKLLRVDGNHRLEPFDVEKTDELWNDIDKIEIAIQSLHPVYTKFKNEGYGNISMMAVLIYYKLYDEAMFDSFVKWIINNGLNKLPSNDILPSHSADSLLLLFEQIYNRKKKEVFISMQFGDPQSEMIYEKVIQTISRFNEIHFLDIGITRIRIDQSVQPYAFSIPEEILRAIDSSSLIIADLSSANINVYHEVGYAMGIAKEKDIESPIVKKIQS